jgi:hypothetical protein
MFLLLLNSIYKYGNLNKDTVFLVYTTNKFMNIIKKNMFYNMLINTQGLNESISFEINDTYNTVEKACKARIDLFDLLVAPKYNYSRILYLDTDIIVKGDLQVIFDVCVQDKLYVLEEGFINSNTDFWGKSLFVSACDLETYDKEATAFTSGILLFNNCEKIKNLFTNIRHDMIARPFQFYCHDQPYIIYNAFKYGLYDNQLLKPFVVNNDYNVCSSKIIHHFPGGPGIHQNKINNMIKFLAELKQLQLHR